MKFHETKIHDAFLIENFNHNDSRGAFVKTFNEGNLINENLDFKIKESYYSISKKNVIRGMHFQLPPFDHKKLVYVVKGAVLDVILDLRPESPTFKKHFHVRLTEDNNRSLIIPTGVAHGFLSLRDESIMIYNVTSLYHNKYDTGINFNSFGFDWKVKNPILSERDISLKSLDSFLKTNPF